MKKSRLTLIFFSCLVFSVGQQVHAQEITLEVPGNREIEPAYRITKQPELIDTIIPYSEIQYPLLSLKYETTFALDTIKAAKIKLIDQLPDLYKSYVKLGVGSKLMPLAEVYYNSERSRKHLYGIHFKHLSSFGNMKNYAPAQFDRTKLTAYGKILENKYSLDGRVHFSSMGLHHYGLQNELSSKDSIAQRFTDFGTSFTYLKHKHDTLSFNYQLNLQYNYYQDKKSPIDSLKNPHSKENYVNLNGKAWYKLGKEIISADAGISLNSYIYSPLNGIDYSISDLPANIIFRLAPNITTYAKNNRLKIKFGAAFAVDVAQAPTKTKAYLYPDIELKYSMFEDILIPYFSIGGGLKQNTFKALSQQNEFILSNIQLANENNAINSTLGIKGTLSKYMMFNVSAAFGVYKNKALFITDTLFSRKNQFAVVYDNINITTITGSLTYQLDEKIKIEGIGTFNSYQTKHNSFAWNLPQIQVIARGSYQLLSNLICKIDLDIEGGRYAQVYTKAESDHEENQQFAKKLSTIVDINMGAEYQYNQKLSAFLQFNNFASQRYKRWYNYPVQGFQVMGGVTFKF